MELHSVASGLHGSLARPEDYSRVARSRSNSQSYAKCQVPPNRGKEMGVRPGGGRLCEGVVFGTILSICSSSVLEAPHVRSLEFPGSPTNQDPAAIPEFG